MSVRCPYRSRYAWPILALSLVLTLATGVWLVDPRTGELQLEIDPSPNRFLPEDDEDKLFYEHVRQVFGSDETLLVVLGADDVFTHENLERLTRMTQRISGIEGVHHVVSLTNALHIRGTNEELEIAPFVSEIPSDPAELARIRREALANPIFAGNLVAKDGRAAALLVYFLDFSDSEFIKRGITDQIAQAANEERGDAKVWVTGTPYIKVEQIRTLYADLGRNIPLILLVGMVVLAFSFRTWRGVMLPALVLLVSMIWTMGVAAWLDRPLNVITVLVPPLLMILGLAYSVHIISEHYDVLRDGTTPKGRSPVEHVMDQIWLPVTLTGTTTAAGFLSMVVSPMQPIREFGWLSLLGTLFTMLASLAMTPAFLDVLGTPKRLAAGAETGPDRFERLAERLAVFNLRHRRAVFVGAGLIALASLLAATQIRVGTAAIGTFRPNHPVRVGFEAVNERFNGANAFNVIVSADYRGAFKDPVNLRELEKLQAWLESQPEIGGSTSIVEYLELINQGFHNNDPEYLTIPDSSRMVSQLLFFGANDELESFVDSQYQTANILVRTSVIDSNLVLELTRRIDEHLGQLPQHLKARTTGNPVLINRMLDDLIWSQTTSLFGTLVLIYLMLWLLFLSARTGAIALIPNVLPILVFFGALGVSGVLLSPATSLIAPMALGVAVDDTIHYFARFNLDAKRLASEEAGTAAAMRAVGRPVTYTTVAICLGFLVLMLSDLRDQVHVGALGAFTLGVGWILEMTVTPALCAGLHVVTLWDRLTLDLGESPQTSIPIFRGLSAGQARVVALMASMREVPAGERLFHEGEVGREMYVIIDGRLEISVQGSDGNRIALNSCGRGEVVGEVGLFYQKRSADADVAEKARLLRLTQSHLQRLGKRYPRIASKVLLNLAELLAERVLRTTVRLR